MPSPATDDGGHGGDDVDDVDDPDATVFVSKRVDTQKRYHPDADCPYLNRADAIREIPLASAQWSLEECRYCQGVVDRSIQDRSLYQALLEAGAANE